MTLNDDINKLKEKTRKALIKIQNKHKISVDSFCLLRRDKEEWIQHSVTGTGGKINN